MKDTREALNPGTKVGAYVIDSCVGRGGSALVYKVGKGNKKYILKEIYPYRMATDGKIYRSLLDDKVTVNEKYSDDVKEKYSAELAEYYNLQDNELNIATILRDSDGINNPYIFQAEEVIHNDVKSLIIDTEGGEMLSEVLSKRLVDQRIEGVRSLKEVLELTRGIIEMLKHIHNHGYIHGDISPDNLHVSLLGHNDNVSERIIRTIDYNNTCAVTEVQHKKFSSKQKYSPLELKRSDMKRKINFSSDLYSVGIILCEMLNPSFVNVEKINKLTSSYFTNETKEVVEALKNLIYAALIERIANCDDFLKQINEVIYLIDCRYRLEGNFYSSDKLFVGREDELNNIENEFRQGKHIVILKGIGGVGKSSLANAFAKKHTDQYEKILVVSYQETWFHTVINDDVIRITNYSKEFIKQYNEQDMENESRVYYKAKLKKIKDLLGDKSLIIIDNMNNGIDDDWNDIVSLPCDILITTRNHFADYKTMDIDMIEDMKASMDIFRYHYGKQMTTDEEKWLEEIIQMVGSLPLIIELIAKSVQAAHITLTEIYDAITNSVFAYPEEKIALYKDGDMIEKKMDDILKIIFDLTVLTEKEQDVMRDMTLISRDGINIKKLKEICDLGNYDPINRLIEMGYIQFQRELECVSLHPVISDVCCKELKPNIDNARVVMDNFRSSLGGKLGTVPYTKGVEVANAGYFMLGRILLGKEEHIPFILDIADIYESLGEYKRSQEVYEQALEICDEIYEESHGNLVYIYFKLGSIAKKTKQYEWAKELLDKVWNMCTDLYDDNHEYIGWMYAAYATIYVCKEEYEQAIDWYEKALSRMAEMYEDNHEEVAEIYRQLARLYLKTHDTAMMSKMIIKAAEISAELGGESIVRTYWLSGELFSEVGQHEIAIEDYEKALNIEMESGSTLNANAGKLYYDIAHSYYILERYTEALRMCEESMRIQAELFAEESEGVQILSQKLEAITMAEERKRKIKGKLIAYLERKEATTCVGVAAVGSFILCGLISKNIYGASMMWIYHIYILLLYPILYELVRNKYSIEGTKTNYIKAISIIVALMPISFCFHEYYWLYLFLIPLQMVLMIMGIIVIVSLKPEEKAWTMISTGIYIVVGAICWIIRYNTNILDITNHICINKEVKATILMLMNNASVIGQSDTLIELVAVQNMVIEDQNFIHQLLYYVGWSGTIIYIVLLLLFVFFLYKCIGKRYSSYKEFYYVYWSCFLYFSIRSIGGILCSFGFYYGVVSLPFNINWFLMMDILCCLIMLYSHYENICIKSRIKEDEAVMK